MAYHHGNARAALLQAAGELLEGEGATNLSLRRVAERAGLSRQAPYNHFANKEALLAELAADGFRALLDGMTADQGHAPLDRLAHAGERYIAFGMERPALFRLMFGRELVDLRRYPATEAIANASLARLSTLIADLGPTSDLDEVTLVAWSLVHGYTELCIEGGIEEPDLRSARARLFAFTVATLAQAFPPQVRTFRDAPGGPAPKVRSDVETDTSRPTIRTRPEVPPDDG